MFTAVIHKRDYILLVIVGEFSLLCCTSKAHAGNTKMRAKIISAYGKKCSISGFSSLREGRRAKTQVYVFPGHENITQRSDDGKASKYYVQFPGVMQGSQEGKRTIYGARVTICITYWTPDRRVTPP